MTSWELEFAILCAVDVRRAAPGRGCSLALPDADRDPSNTVIYIAQVCATRSFSVPTYRHVHTERDQATFRLWLGRESSADAGSGTK